MSAADPVDQKTVSYTHLDVYKRQGYTCGDLFWQKALLEAAREEMLRIAAKTKQTDALIFVGLPFAYGGKLYNIAAALNHGAVLGLIPKTHLPNYGEFYEARQFAPAPEETGEVILDGKKVPFGTRLLFTCPEMEELTVAAEICEDLWVDVYKRQILLSLINFRLDSA